MSGLFPQTTVPELIEEAHEILAKAKERFLPKATFALVSGGNDSTAMLSIVRDQIDAVAETYSGPHPIICHPPCGPWGKYRANCLDGIEHGIIAMDMVHQFGGVVEHPVGSPLFEIYGRQGFVQRVNQLEFGHMARKPTLLLLYWFLP